MIYADFNGSAPLLPAVIEYLTTRLQEGPYANPNAIHSLGKKMGFGIEKCRRTCAKALGASSNQLIFNSGSSEGITQVFHSVLNHERKERNTIITSGIEHSAVVAACKYYKDLGKNICVIKTLSNGQVDLEDFKRLIKEHGDDIAMVTVMAANNETGIIQPWQEIAKICNENNLIYFSDTTQYIGKIDFNFQKSGMDYAVISGHKVGALIGSGILIAKNPQNLRPLIFGGGQENGLRGGTQNYIGNETLAVALDFFNTHKHKLESVYKQRENFESNMKKAFPQAVIIGDNAPRLASTTMIAFPGVHGQAVQIELESQGIFVTTSSACSDNEPETSKVLKAMGIKDDIGRGVVRISLCLDCNSENYTEIETALKKAYTKLREIRNF